MKEMTSEFSSLRTEIWSGQMVDKTAYQVEVLKTTVKPRR
ncbi:hypothetical protein AAULH_06186 [Lactobacillus helveticus MTCC 5463]|nr:hypothetical protein AAULH_06186 [Lactobacillus helveticus MTCC 5463]